MQSPGTSWVVSKYTDFSYLYVIFKAIMSLTSLIQRQEGPLTHKRCHRQSKPWQHRTVGIWVGLGRVDISAYFITLAQNFLYIPEFTGYWAVWERHKPFLNSLPTTRAVHVSWRSKCDVRVRCRTIPEGTLGKPNLSAFTMKAVSYCIGLCPKSLSGTHTNVIFYVTPLEMRRTFRC